MLAWPEFMWRALAAGLLLAAMAGPLGCLIVWRRMVYFGDTMAHSALLGVGLGLMLQVNLALGVGIICLGVALLLLALQRLGSLATDTLLGLLAHSALALGLVLVSLFEGMRWDPTAYLFGDVLAVSWQDVTVLGVTLAGVMTGLAVLWRQLLALTVDPDLARAEGVKVDALRLAHILMMACLIAVAMKIVGILLITALLIIPAAAARSLARSPEVMAAAASLLGMGAVIGGLALSWQTDTPTGPSIVVAALGLFLLTLPMAALRRA